MAERGIIFSGDMVRAILDGRKSQTRRVMKPQSQDAPDGGYIDAYDGGPQWNWWTPGGVLCNNRHIWTCPYGVPGDRLYVREAFALTPKGTPFYRADLATCETGVLHVMGGWKPSIHMPKAHARIWLEIADVRVERVLDISNGDILAEGTPELPIEETDDPWENFYRAFSMSFEQLWDSINGQRGYGWDANPWVWVLDFKRIER